MLCMLYRSVFLYFLLSHNFNTNKVITVVWCFVRFAACNTVISLLLHNNTVVSSSKIKYTH